MGKYQQCRTGLLLKKIREDLGLKQKELECEGAKNISQLESGVKNITEKIADILANRINLLIKQRNLHLDYMVTKELLTGDCKLFTSKILKRLNSEPENFEDILNEINEDIRIFNTEDCIELILGLIEFLKGDLYRNADLIKQYLFILLKLDLPQEVLMYVYNDLIRIHYINNEHKEIVIIAKAIEDDFAQSTDCKLKNSFFCNVARTYYRLGMNKEYKEALKKTNRKKDLQTNLFTLNIDANAYLSQGEYLKAEKIYLDMVNKCITNNMYDYLVNVYSNLAELYMSTNRLDEAIDIIYKALKFKDKPMDKQFTYNIYLNLIQVEINRNNKELVDKTFFDIFNIAIELKNEELKNMAIIKVINYYDSIKMHEELYNLVLKLRLDLGVELSDKVIIYLGKVFKAANKKVEILNLL